MVVQALDLVRQMNTKLCTMKSEHVVASIMLTSTESGWSEHHCVSNDKISHYFSDTCFALARLAEAIAVLRKCRSDEEEGGDAHNMRYFRHSNYEPQAATSTFETLI